MSCDLITRVREIEAAYMALRARCAPEAASPSSESCVVPFILELVGLAKAVAEGPYGVTETVSQPSIPVCLSDSFLTDLAAWIEGMTCVSSEPYSFNASVFEMLPFYGLVADGSLDGPDWDGRAARYTISVNGVTVWNSLPWYEYYSIEEDQSQSPSRRLSLENFHALLVEGANMILIEVNAADFEYSATFGEIGDFSCVSAWIQLEGESSRMWTGQTILSDGTNTGFSQVGFVPMDPIRADAGVITRPSRYSNLWTFSILPEAVFRF